MNKLQRLRDDLIEIGHRYENNPKECQEKMEDLLILNLDCSYKNNCITKYFDLPSYETVLAFTKRLHFKVMRNSRGQHRLQYAGV